MADFLAAARLEGQRAAAAGQRLLDRQECRLQVDPTGIELDPLARKAVLRLHHHRRLGLEAVLDLHDAPHPVAKQLIDRGADAVRVNPEIRAIVACQRLDHELGLRLEVAADLMTLEQPELARRI